MKRPRPVPKTGRSWLVWDAGGVWQVKRLERRGFLRVVSFDWNEVPVRALTPRGRLVRRFSMLKPQSKGVRGTGKLAAEDPLAWKELPRWREFLLAQTYSDGVTERQAGLVIFRADGDGWQFTLKDPTSCTMLKVSARTWDEALLVVEGLLGDPDAPWETDPYESAKRGRSRGRRS